MAKDELELSPELQGYLKTIVEHFANEDDQVRQRQIRLSKKLKYFWDNITQIWWDNVAHDWRVWDGYDANNSNGEDNTVYDKPVNIFKAYLEAIIAALSVNIPAIICTPDDAESPLDLQTAKAGDKIAKLVSSHNNVTLLWLHALFVFCTEGMVAAYHYSHEDEKYGTYKKDEYKEVDVPYTSKVCPNCAQPLIEEMGGNYCIACDELVEPQITEGMEKQLQLVGVTHHPKSRQCIEVYGNLFVKTPVYARSQEECPYLIYAYETHYANAIAEFPSVADKLVLADGKIKTTNSGLSMNNDIEVWGRLSTQYMGEYPQNQVTISCTYLRPAAYNTLTKENADRLREEFPKGCKVTFVNDLFAEACECEFDKYWTLTYNPLSDYLHHDPLAHVLVPIQEINNTMISLILQTIEHGIPQTFADPGVLNFQAYGQNEATPGQIYPAKAPVGRGMSEGFYEIKTATLSQEVEPFMQRMQEAGQFVSGALPSLFGGAAPNSSKTAAQYSMSRAQALQRLQTTWKILLFWWKDIFGKVIPAYIENVMEDERYVERTKDGGFVNIFIRKAELEGKIGNVELEASEQLPVTWAQRKDALMQFLQQVPDSIQYLSAPENLNILKDALGIQDFVMPGMEDRDKQYVEIQQLINSQPIIDVDPMTQMEMEMPSVAIDPDIDNHMIEAEICRSWLISDVGRDARANNPEGYKNVLLHFKQHKMALMAAQLPQPQVEETENPNVD